MKIRCRYDGSLSVFPPVTDSSLRRAVNDALPGSFVLSTSGTELTNEQVIDERISTDFAPLARAICILREAGHATSGSIRYAEGDLWERGGTIDSEGILRLAFGLDERPPHLGGTHVLRAEATKIEALLEDVKNGDLGKVWDIEVLLGLRA